MPSSNTVVNNVAFIICNVLCFISTAKDTLPKDVLIAAALSHYNDEEISEAKTRMVTICSAIGTNRKGPNKKKSEVEDIYKYFDKIHSENIDHAPFLSDKYDAFPPSNAGCRCAAAASMSSIHELNDKVGELNKNVEDFAS
jgi:hypothetical protein